MPSVRTHEGYLVIIRTQFQIVISLVFSSLSFKILHLRLKWRRTFIARLHNTKHKAADFHIPDSNLNDKRLLNTMSLFAQIFYRPLFCTSLYLFTKHIQLFAKV